jgi:hypothetical protein
MMGFGFQLRVEILVKTHPSLYLKLEGDREFMDFST